MGGGVIIAAAKMRKERGIVAYLRQRGALSVATATALETPQRVGRFALRSLLRHGAVTETGDGSYWLDEAAYESMRTTRRRRAGWALIGLLLILAVIVVAMMGKTT